MLTRLQDYEKMKLNKESPIVFLERSLYSDKNVFMKNFGINGVTNTAELEVYNNWCKFSLEKIEYTLDAIIYLRASPEKCL